MAASQVVNRKPAIKLNTDKMSCHPGTPLGILAIITMGEVNGMMLAQIITLLSGVLRLATMMMNAKMMGIVIGSIRD